MTTQCSECGVEMQPRPVPGATRFPRRLECPTHGYYHERRSGMADAAPDWREGLKSVPDIPEDWAEAHGE